MKLWKLCIRINPCFTKIICIAAEVYEVWLFHTRSWHSYCFGFPHVHTFCTLVVKVTNRQNRPVPPCMNVLLYYHLLSISVHKMLLVMNFRLRGHVSTCTLLRSRLLPKQRLEGNDCGLPSGTVWYMYRSSVEHLPPPPPRPLRYHVYIWYLISWCCPTKSLCEFLVSLCHGTYFSASTR